jgi:hypothetical protein
MRRKSTTASSQCTLCAALSSLLCFALLTPDSIRCAAEAARAKERKEMEDQMWLYIRLAMQFFVLFIVFVPDSIGTRLITPTLSVRRILSDAMWGCDVMCCDVL